jgi:hypothetical protein
MQAQDHADRVVFPRSIQPSRYDIDVTMLLDTPGSIRIAPTIRIHRATKMDTQPMRQNPRDVSTPRGDSQKFSLEPAPSSSFAGQQDFGRHDQPG